MGSQVNPDDTLTPEQAAALAPAFVEALKPLAEPHPAQMVEFVEQLLREVVHLRKQRDELHVNCNQRLEQARSLDEMAMVGQFHRTFGVPVKTELELPNETLCQSESYRSSYEEIAKAMKWCPAVAAGNRRQLRVRLLLEEATEYLTAELNDDLVEIADGLADMVYIICGTAHEYGIPLDAVFREVHRSNMAKVGPDGKAIVRDDGKIIKPAGWTPPDIAGVLGVAK